MRKPAFILHPGLSHDRFGQLRVKAAFGPAESRRLRGPDPKHSGQNGALVIPGMSGGREVHTAQASRPWHQRPFFLERNIRSALAMAGVPMVWVKNSIFCLSVVPLSVTVERRACINCP